MVFFKKYEKYIYLVLVFSLSYYLQISVAFIGLDLHHDLIMFDASRNFHLGFHPYKDFFYQYNFGTILIHNIALSIWGVKIASLKAITVYFYAFIAALIYLCCAVQGLKRWGFCIALLWSFLSPFYSPLMDGYHAWPTIYAMALVMAGALMLLLALREEIFVNAFLAGVFFSLAFWMKQVAAYQILAVIIWLAIGILAQQYKKKLHQFNFLRIAIGYSLGGVIAAIPFLWYLISNHLFEEWVNNTIIFNKYFALDSNNGSLISIFFPVGRELGFRSIIWSIIPALILIAFYLQRFSKFSFNIKNIYSEHFYIYLLFLFLTISGWAQFFPLPHPFHLQIFMAPAFVAIAMLAGYVFNSVNKIVDNKIIFLATLFTLGVIFYESGRLLSKIIIKMNQPRVVVNEGTPFDGIKLLPVDEKKLIPFYKTLIEISNNSYTETFTIIPLSVDPLRALLPISTSAIGAFKMGLDWTWPNEIVEEGFNDRVKGAIQEKKHPIYSDSIRVIPGYKVKSVLEMKSPITWVHTLYVPSPSHSSTRVTYDSISNTMHGSSVNLFGLEDRALIEEKGYNRNLTFIPINLTSYDLTKINQVDLSYISEQDIPKKINKLYYFYLERLNDVSNDFIAKYYLPSKNGVYKLKENLRHEEILSIEKFYLSEGKIAHKQNLPKYVSNKTSLITFPRIFILSKEHNKNANIEWIPEIHNINPRKRDGAKLNYYIAIPDGILDHDSQGLIAIQISMTDGSINTNYIDYTPTKNKLQNFDKNKNN